jgi:hypothetical protein
VVAERAVLGALLLEPACVDTVVEILPSAGAFYQEAHALIYSAILALRGRGEAIDAIAVGSELEARAVLARAGGRSELAHLVDGAVSAATVETHARTIARLAALREIRAVGLQVSQRACDPCADPMVLVDAAAENLASIAHHELGDGWGPFVSLDHARELPELPLDALSPWLRDMVAALAHAYQTPPELPGMYALALVSGAIAGKYVVVVRRGWRMPPVLYVLVALPPSERKSPVIYALAEPLRRWEREQAQAIAAQRKEALVRVDQARARVETALRMLTRPSNGADLDELASAHGAAVRALTEAEAAVPPEPRLIVEYATPEALAERMVDNGDRQIIVSDEGAGVLAMTGRYARFGGADLDLLLRGYDGLPYTPARITRTARPMTAATLAIALGAQPAAIADMLQRAPEIRERGLLARFLALVPRPRVGSRRVRAEPVPRSSLTEYERCMRALLDVPDEYVDGRLAPRELHLSGAADDTIAAFEERLEPELGRGGRYERIAPWAGKLAGTAARIAAGLHVADYADRTMPAEIPTATVERALRLAQACLPHTEALEDRLTAPPELDGARRIAEWLRKNGRAMVSDREILRATRGTAVLATANQRDAALRLLEGHGYIRRTSLTTPGPGRRTARWQVRPDWIASQTPHGRPDGQNGRNASASSEDVDSVHIVHGDDGSFGERTPAEAIDL